MFMMRSSTHISPPEAPFPLIGLCYEETLLEVVLDLEEMLAVSTKHCHLDRAL